MATLVQRIGRVDTIPKDECIDGHAWEAGLELYLQGHITLAQASAWFNMTSSQETELAYFKSEFDSRNFSGKLAFFQDLIAATTAFQIGAISEAKFRTILGLPETSPTTTSSTTSTTTTTTTAP